MQTLRILRQFQIERDPETGLLKSSVGLDILERQYDVIYKNYGDVIILNYAQLGRDTDVSKECRGLILSPRNGWEVVSRGFDRFYNYNQNTPFDFKNSTILEKVDGSYIGLFYFNGCWNFQTRGTLAEGEISADCPLKSWKEACLSALLFDSDEEFQKWANERLLKYKGNTTFIFELVSPWNRVVKWYPTAELYCLGARTFDPVTGETHGWMTPHEQADIFYKSLEPKIYSFTDYAEISKVLNTNFFGDLDEGLVCWNQKTGERVKIKRDHYLALHRLKGNTNCMNKKVAMELVRTGEIEEILTYFPEYEEILRGLEKKFNGLAKEAEQEYERLKDIEVQKEFALEALKTPFSGVLFCLRSNKFPTAKDCLANMKSEKLLELLCEN